MDVHILLWIGLFLSTFFLLLLAVKKKRATSDWFLMAWLVVSGLHLAFYLHNLFYYSVTFEWIYRLGFSLSLVHTPLLFLYVCASTGDRRWFFRQFYLHFIPYLLFCLAVLTFLSVKEVGVVKYGFLVWVSHPPPVLKFYGVLLAISGLIYPVWSYLVLMRYQREVLPNFFSSDVHVTLNWLKYWVAASLIYFVVVFVLIVLAIDAGLMQVQTIFKWVASVIVLHLVYIGFFGLRQTAIFSNYPIIHQEKKVKEKNRTDQRMLAEKLTSIMRQRKPYLNPELSLPILAGQSGMTSHELSSLINDHFGVNFYRFINGYRIEEFKHQVQQPENKNLKILAVAYASGFNSKSTFNKVFSELTGESPSEFRRRIGET